MPYKLQYFNARGTAEPIRYLLKYGKINFEDVRIESSDWPKIKATMPMGQMPILECDGKRFFQSVAICRFLAKKVGLAGSNELENLEIDSIADTVVDLRLKIMAVSFGPQDKKAEGMKTLKEETVPFFLSKLNAIAEENNGHLACKKLTWADFYFAAFVIMFQFGAQEGEKVWEKYPALKKVKENVENIDEIKKWIAVRPVTDL
ncbi:hypothetical protein PVAND_016426 [Polypedilum vanderplanki]|uniref:glutathione transferase n=1 Tax=Polypedilum vanderplanki TaxID=319348 RepID=A0A9J6BFW1_POLVA|nr:hypothetical protein PVAND_016426 [Polypedilum vanderplanki]